MKHPIPVCENTTGWPLIGYAETVEQAIRVVKKHLSDSSLSLVKNYGFQLNVWKRTPFSIELCGGPACYTWAIGKTLPKH